MMRRIGGLPAVLLGGLVPLVAAGVAQDLDPDTGLARWQFREGALDLQLVQRLPDQTRAFFMGRGFDAASADRFARACVFQVIVRNATQPDTKVPALAIDLAHWRVDQDDPPAPLPLEAEWQQRWEASGQSQQARIAFRWALFPTQQVFRPGDYNWGMIPLGPPPGTVVGVDLTWHEDGQLRRGRIPGIQCSPDEVADER